MIKKTQNLSLHVSHLKGVGPKRGALFAQKGIRTILDLLFFTPIRYEDRRHAVPIEPALQRDDPVLVQGRVVLGREEKLYPSRKSLFRIRIEDGGSTLDLLWFRYKRPYLMSLARPGNALLAYGRVRESRGFCRMIHPEVTPMDGHPPVKGSRNFGFFGVYSNINGLSPRLLRSTMDSALNHHLLEVIDPIPRDLTEPLGLPDLPGAVGFVHRPPPHCSLDELNRHDTPSHKRLLFDRFFLVMMAVAFLKKAGDRECGYAMGLPSSLERDLDTLLPFALTPYQKKVVRAIAADLASGKPMNRLILGDVGCGKTAVAAVAALICAQNRKQAAFMVPTQILAKQHMAFFSDLPPEAGLRPVLLTGQSKASERRELHGKIRSGACNLIIGTQALIQEGINYADLGLVIIDEQHRFGVKERAAMQRKGDRPHQLVMTATPIPRTLAMTLYGDMDISSVDGYPKEHRPVVTRMVPEARKREVFHAVRQTLEAREQCFVICPAIEGPEEGALKNVTDMAAKLERLLSPPYRIGSVHGRLDVEERERIMEDFRAERIDLLVGTTVLEVGIHIPGATLMVVEHPERFGLAQLHQLRGRVGRGTKGGHCILMVSEGLSEKALSRLEFLSGNHDGFEIARKDLEMRGQGELAGSRQAGIGELDFQEIVSEQELFFKAKEAADRLLDRDPFLSHPANAPLRAFVESTLTASLD